VHHFDIVFILENMLVVGEIDVQKFSIDRRHCLSRKSSYADVTENMAAVRVR
jgi:hypothetical protein